MWCIRSYIFGAGDDDTDPEKGGVPVLQPLVSEDALIRMEQLVSDAVEKGARLITGGKRANRAGFFLEPTILADVTSNMNLSCSEIFGPILAVQSFEAVDDAFTAANDSE